MKKLSLLLFTLFPLLALATEDVIFQDVVYTLNDDGNATVSGKNNQKELISAGSADLVIPDNITHSGTTYKVVGVEDGAFYNVQRITSVKIGENVTTIGKAAFAKCLFSEITIPQAVTQIKDSAFADCAALADIYLEWSSLDNLNFGANIFAGIAADAKAHILDCTDLTYLENSTNQKWQGVTLDLPYHIVVINSSNSQAGTVKMTYPSESAATSIISASFKFGDSSDSIVVEATEKDFSHWEDGNGNIITPYFILKTKLTTCAPSFTAVFESDDYVWREAVIDDLKVILYTSGDSATVASENSEYPNENLVIPDKVSFQNTQYPVVGIDSGAFQNNKHILSVTISQGISSIGNNAFAKSNIKNITLPSTITRIGTEAFSGCASLLSISLQEDMSDILIGGDDGVYKSASNCDALANQVSDKCLVDVEHDFRNKYRDKWGGLSFVPDTYYVSGKNIDMHGGLVVGYGYYAYDTEIPLSVIGIDRGWQVVRWEDNKGDVFTGASIVFPLLFAEDMQVWPIFESGNEIATLLPISASVRYSSGILHLPGFADGKASVYAISGRMITSFIVPDAEVVPLALPSGIYLLELSDNHSRKRLKLFMP